MFKIASLQELHLRKVGYEPLLGLPLDSLALINVLMLFNFSVLPHFLLNNLATIFFSQHLRKIFRYTSYFIFISAVIVP